MIQVIKGGNKMQYDAYLACLVERNEQSWYCEPRIIDYNDDLMSCHECDNEECEHWKEYN